MKVRGGDDLIAGADAQCHHGDKQGVGSRANRDTVLDPDIRGQLLLQLTDFRSHNVSAVMENLVDILF